MPNWKKVIVSGSDAILNEVTASSGLDTTDVTIDGWGSVSSSLASIEAGGASQTLQDVTDNGSTTTNLISAPGITINSSGSDFLKLGLDAGENASNGAIAGDGGVIIGTNALRDFNGTTEKVTIVGNYTADQTTNFGDLVTLVGSSIVSGTNRNVGDSTTAVGAQALNGQTGGNEGNTAIGTSALFNFKGGKYNIALGYNSGPQAIFTGSEGIYIGREAGTKHNSNNVPPSQSIYIGTEAKSTFGSSYGAAMTVNEIVIGNNVNGNGTNTVTIGNSSTTNNYFFGDIDADDITIDNWGSVSASLAALNVSSSAANQNLQEVTDNGATTTNSLTIDSGTITINASNGAGVGGDTIFNGGYKTVNTEKKASFVEDNDSGVTDLFKTSYKLSDNTLTSIPDGKYFYQSQYQYRDGTGASDFAYGFKFLGQRGSSGGDTSNEASIFKIGISTNSGTWNNAIFRIHGNSLNGGGNGYIHMFNPIINEALLISGSTQAIEARTYGITQTLKSGIDEDPYNDTIDLKTIEIGTDQFAVSSSYIDLPNLEENPSDKTFRILVGGHDSDQSGPHFNGQRGSGLVKYITSQSLFEGTGIVSGSTAQTLQQVTDNGSTTTNNITIDSTSDAQLILDRAANTNDSEILFKTNGTTNWSIGTGQVGSETEFTFKGQDGANYIRINQSGQADFLSAVTASAVHIGDYTEIGSNRLTIADGADATVTQLALATYCGVFVDYTIYSTDAGQTNMRTGTYRAVFNDSEVQDSETMTNDIGDTNGFVLSTSLGGTNFTLTANNDIGQQCRVSYTVKPIKL